jgi:hypothetical protein
MAVESIVVLTVVFCVLFLIFVYGVIRIAANWDFLRRTNQRIREYEDTSNDDYEKHSWPPAE